MLSGVLSREPLWPLAIALRAKRHSCVKPIESRPAKRRVTKRGTRRLCPLPRIALTRARCHPETKDYIARKRAEGKTGLEAMRCLERRLTRRIWHLLQAPAPTPDQTLTPPNLLT